MAEDMLKFEATRYMMKKISENHELVKGLIAEASNNARDFAVYNHEILNKFMGGINTPEYKEIKEHKERFKLKCAYYNYFDFETLCAYNRFLEKIIEYARREARDKGGRVTTTVLNNSIDEASKFLLRNINKEGMYYYKGYAKLARKENGYALNPTKTTKMEIDPLMERLYMDYISKYFNDKYRKREVKVVEDVPMVEELKTKNVVEDIVEDIQVENEFEIFEYSYRGKKLPLKIFKQDYFFSEEGYPIRRIHAASEWGELIACLDQNNEVYCGNLYDDESNILEDREESGEAFFPSRELREIIAQERELKNQQEDANKPKTNELRNGLVNYTIPGIDN